MTTPAWTLQDYQTKEARLSPDIFRARELALLIAEVKRWVPEGKRWMVDEIAKYRT